MTETSIYAREVIQRAAIELQDNFDLDGGSVGLLLATEGARRMMAERGMTATAAQLRSMAAQIEQRSNTGDVL